MFKRWSKIMLLLFGCAVLGLSAAQVGSVKFVQTGKNPVPEELLKVALRLRPGMEFSTAHMDEDLKNLYKTGKISDVSSEFKTMKDGRIEITYRIKPSPVISVLKLEGNRKFETKELQECLKVVDGDRLSSRGLSESVENLRKFYIGKGYSDVKIPLPEVVPDGKDGAILEIFWE